MTYSFLTFAINNMTMLQLDQVSREERLVDAIIFNLNQQDDCFLFSQYTKLTGCASRLLVPGGSILFIKNDFAMLMTKDDIGDRFSMSILDSPTHIFILNPTLAEAACKTMPELERQRNTADPGLLAHILHSSIPVLTQQGENRKNQLQDLSSSGPDNLIISLIDNFLSVSALLRLAEERYKLDHDRALRTLHQCQTEGNIFPIFPRLQFLSRCYSQRKSFRLGSYLVASKVISESQLEDLIDTQWTEAEAGNRRMLGQIAVQSGLISARQLEVFLFDQFVYGRQEKSDKLNTKSVTDSIIGSLGTMSPGGLLQSLASDAKSGLLTVEHNGQSLHIAYSFGKITQAQLAKLKGVAAVVQFLANWSEGIFVFKNKAEGHSFDQQCQIKKAVETMLLDAALAEDQNNQILVLLKDGQNSILEKVWDFEQKWRTFLSKNVQFIDETLLDEGHKKECFAIARAVDGFCTVKDLVQINDHWPTNKVLKYLHVLFVENLVTVQTGSIMALISSLQAIAGSVAEKIGFAENLEMLRSSIDDSGEDNSSIFVVDEAGNLCVNFRFIKERGLSISAICQRIDQLQETYLHYCAAELDQGVLAAIVAAATQGKSDHLTRAV